MVTHDNLAAHGKTTLAVDGQGIYFYYGRYQAPPILNNINITVNRGTIYGLLGPSGCGKTTLLKCIVGYHKPQGGSVKLYGRSPGSKGFFIPGRGVGYMPQDLALYMEMTTEEILTYFGFLCGMDVKSLPESIQSLITLLELPSKTKRIKHLSGGEQRRVSFAVALVHKPPLLILDEPTIGVDPLLRKTIWDHLVSLTRNEHTTVIITTHYTEEARQAHTVGLMRFGHQLVEGNPENLIQQCGSFTLEGVFLKICQKNRNNDEDLETKIAEHRSIGFGNEVRNGAAFGETIAHKTDELYTNAKAFLSTNDGTLDGESHVPDNAIALLPLPLPPIESGHEKFRAISSWMRLCYLTKKNFLRMQRNVLLMLFTIIVAAVHVTIFFLCLSSDPFDLPIAVANEEQDMNKFAETFLLSINNNTIRQIPFRNFTLAYESLKKGESWGTLHIGSEFSTCLADRFLEGENASNDTIECSTIHIILDTSNYVIAGTIRKSLWESYEVFAKNLLRFFSKNPSTAELPMRIQEYGENSKPASFAEFVSPSLIMCNAFILSVAMTEMAIIAEKKHGLLSRTLVAGATIAEVLMSFFFALFTVMFLHVLVMMAVTFWVFSIPCNGPVFWIIIATMLTGVCGMSYGIFISALTDDENTAALISCGSFFPIIILSGSIWPVEAMPYYLRYFTNCLPLTRIIEAGRSIMTRGWNITDSYVWDGYLICSAWAAVQLALSAILFKIRK